MVHPETALLSGSCDLSEASSLQISSFSCNYLETGTLSILKMEVATLQNLTEMIYQHINLFF